MTGNGILDLTLTLSSSLSLSSAHALTLILRSCEAEQLQEHAERDEQRPLRRRRPPRARPLPEKSRHPQQHL